MTSTPAIIPVPATCVITDQAPLLLTERSVISTGNDPALDAPALYLASLLGVRIVAHTPAGCSGISLYLDQTLSGKLGPEGYRLTIGGRDAAIHGATPAGVFYGVQTLRQLLPPDVERFGVRANGGRLTVPAVTIEDRPRFGWRGVMLDVARYFASVAEVKRILDLMALHKLNVFHWHLVDDQGWRLEIKKYPRLTEIGAWREQSSVVGDETRGDGIPHGGFYSQEDIREVVAYAAERHIRVMPEIEIPGHTSAALAAYPHLGNTDAPGFSPGVQWRMYHICKETYAPKSETVAFLDDVFAEVLVLFPSQFIHIGGDEALKEQWDNSPQARTFMQANGLKNGNELQSWFVRRTGAFLAKHGRRLIGWDEIQEGGLAPGAAMMAWRDAQWAAESGHDPTEMTWALDAARAGHDVVMAPVSTMYFDYNEGGVEEVPVRNGARTPLARVYAFEPVPAELEPQYQSRVLGAQAQLWRESMPGWPQVEYRAFPRLSALAEAVWSPPGRKDFTDFQRRLPRLLARLDRLGVNYRKPRATDEAGSGPQSTVS